VINNTLTLPLPEFEKWAKPRGQVKIMEPEDPGSIILTWSLGLAHFSYSRRGKVDVGL